MALSSYARRELEAAGFEVVFSQKATFKEFAIRVGRPAREAIADSRAQGVHPGYALGCDYDGLDDALLVCVTEKKTREDIDRLAEVVAAWS